MKSTRAPAPRPGGLGIGGPGGGEGGGSGEFGGGGDGGLGDSGSSGGGLLPVGGGVASPEEPAQAGDPSARHRTNAAARQSWCMSHLPVVCRGVVRAALERTPIIGLAARRRVPLDSSSPPVDFPPRVEAPPTRIRMAATSATAPSPPAAGGLPHDQLLELYYWMRLTRSLEERLVNLYRQTKVVGGLFRSLGQEACAVGSRLRARAGGHALAADPQPRLDAGEGRDAGRGPPPVHGEGRFARRAGASSTSTSATSWTAASSGRSRIWATWSRSWPASRSRSDAEASRGSAWCTWATGRPPPARFTRGSTSPRCSAVRSWSIVENNGYAYSTPTDQQTRGGAARRQGGRLRHPRRSRRRQRRARGVSGHEGGGRSRAARRRRDALELMTYRRKGHAEHDNQSYVPAGEIERWARENDPLDRYLEDADGRTRASVPTS